jgi:hypothetical protein
MLIGSLFIRGAGAVAMARVSTDVCIDVAAIASASNRSEETMSGRNEFPARPILSGVDEKISCRVQPFSKRSHLKNKRAMNGSSK